MQKFLFNKSFWILSIIAFGFLSFYIHFDFIRAAWVEDAKILPSDGVASQGFGYSVDVSGDYAIVGVDNQKKAYIFHFEDGSWIQQAMITTSTGSTFFAENVAIAGDYAMVTDHNDGSQAGAVFVYKRTGSSWDLHQRLVSSDLANQDFFGDKLAMAGEYAIIGAYREDQDAAGANTLSAAGSAYIFKRDGSGVWSQQQKIVPTDRAADDWFGRAVDISESGDYILVGAPNDDDTALSSGSAYVFYRTTSTWAQQAKLNANDPAASDFFGNAVSISDSGEYVVVGAYSNDDAGSASGSGYVFVRSGVSWSLDQKVVASDAAASNFFGEAVAIDGLGEKVAIGASGNTTDTGAVYIFDRESGDWEENEKLVASDASIDSWFGVEVSFDKTNDVLIVGAPSETNVNGSNSGAAYILTFSELTSLSSPEFTTSTFSTSSVQLSWSSAAGATFYSISSTVGSVVTTTETSYTFTGLTPNSSYSFQVRADNVSTSSAYSSVTSTITNALLSISSVTSTNISTSTATISWSTNRLASSRVLYGLVASLGVSTTESNTSSRVTTHEVLMTGLLPCTVYHYTPRAVTADGDVATSSHRTFVTQGCSFSAPVIASESSAVSSSLGATIQLETVAESIALDIPPAFTTSTDVVFQIKQVDTVTVIEDGGIPAGRTVVGSLVFHLKAIANTSTIISEFDEPIELTMTYDPDTLGSLDPTTLVIYRYATSTWTELSPCTINTSLFTVTCDTPGFSLFALMGEEGEGDSDSNDTSSSNGGIPYLPPTLPSSASHFTINQGALSTNSRLVSLHITSPNASMVAVSTDPTFANGSFESLISPLWYTLPLGNGEKTVYVKLRTPEGGELILSDTITLTSNACPLTPEQPYKSSGSPSVFYVTSDCTRRPIPNERTYFTYFSSWSDVGVVTNVTLTSVPLDPLSFLPLGPLYRPTYGALIKTPYDPKVYVLINDTKYWITSEEVFNKLNYRSDWIEDVDPRLLDAYKVGEEITRTDVHPAYTLIKYTTSPKVYRLEVDPTDSSKLIKRWIVTEDAFTKLNFRGDRIIVIDENEVYEDGEELK